MSYVRILSDQRETFVDERAVLKPATLAEIEQIYLKSQELGNLARVQTLANVQDHKGNSFPILKISFGSQDPKAPVLGIIGGVHGLERIGSQVAIAYMNSLSNLLLWDENTHHALTKMRIFFIPMVNPTGVLHLRRSNANGIDLMRNAPVESDSPKFLLSGHRYGPWLPWYRGVEGAPMETEAQAVVDDVLNEISSSALPLTIDIHSGFGVQDQLWFPYAKTAKPFPNLPHFHALAELFDKTYPYHIYKIEPQAQNYTTHGDLWDHIYDQNLIKNPNSTYLPLCLEMGSWLWVKKNPLQIFSAQGPFNPMKKHRERRVLRSHNTLFEFLIKALTSYEKWAALNPEQIHKHLQRAEERWYGKFK